MLRDLRRVRMVRKIVKNSTWKSISIVAILVVSCTKLNHLKEILIQHSTFSGSNVMIKSISVVTLTGCMRLISGIIKGTHQGHSSPDLANKIPAAPGGHWIAIDEHDTASMHPGLSDEERLEDLRNLQSAATELDTLRKIFPYANDSEVFDLFLDFQQDDNARPEGLEPPTF